MENLIRWYHTVSPLKFEQWWFRFARPLAQSIATKHHLTQASLDKALSWPVALLDPLPVSAHFTPQQNRFCFLNRSHSFDGDINWNFREEGLLWCYNLHYFEWLYDDTLSLEDKLATMYSYRDSKNAGLIGQDGYPASLRIVSWIRFILRFNIKDESLISRLYSDADWLHRFPEYHLQGNHLMENAIAITHAGIYFENTLFYKKGKALLERCINEQILKDGGHIEGSPMYHSLLLFRLMQTTELLRFANTQSKELTELIRNTTERMLGWMERITFSDGSWPMVNDSTLGVAPTTGQLQTYALSINIKSTPSKLSDSGYRMVRCGDFELFIDAAAIAPNCQPGHAHADIGSFCLYYRGKPQIVDIGVSTYAASERRMIERGTASHNTITIGGANSSELWKAFRIGRRAKVMDVSDTENSVSISYIPWRFPSTTHRRTFEWTDEQIIIKDELSRFNDNSILHLHMHPTITTIAHNNGAIYFENLAIKVTGVGEPIVNDYHFASGFNSLCVAKKLSYPLGMELVTTKIVRLPAPDSF
jgi:hypothetical protein